MVLAIKHCICGCERRFRRLLGRFRTLIGRCGVGGCARGRKLMLDRRALLTAGVALGALAATTGYGRAQKMTTTEKTIDFKNLSEAEWKQRLNSAQFDVLRKHGTERAGTSPLNKEKRK